MDRKGVLEPFTTIRRTVHISVPGLSNALTAALAGILITAAPATGLIQGGGCVNDVSGLNNNCTANDLTFVAVGLGVQDDGCVSTSDTVSIFLRAQIANTTAQTRYDIGMYFATDGDVNGDGAQSGVCSREILRPASANVGATDCPPLDLNGGVGPFLNADGDTCSDLLAESNPGNCTLQGRTDTQGKTLRDAAIMDFTQAITFPCRDVEITPTGFVNIPLCSTWGNQAGQVSTDANATCDSELEAVPGTKSKCRCEDLDSNIPAPELSLSCTCDAPTTVRPGFPVTCTVSYANAAICTPDPDTAERFQCGTAGFVRFDVDDDRTGVEAGTFEVNNAGRGSTAGTPGEIQWTPASDPQLTAGLIGQGESDSLEFVYNVSQDAADGPVTLTTETIWSNDPSFTDPRIQTLSTTCAITVDATHATVSSFTARADGDRVAVAWETASEAGTVSFDLYRRDTGWVKLNDRPLPATGRLPGASYRFLDETASPGGERVYKVVEQDVWGRRQSHGPYRVSVPHAPSARRLHDGAGEARFEARPKAAPAVDRQRSEAARQEREDRHELSPLAAGAKKDARPARARVEIAESGLVRVPTADLAAAWGMSTAETENAIRQGRVRVTVHGREIGWHATPAGDGVLFYGEGLDSLFTRFNVYVFEADRGPELPTVRLAGKTPDAEPGGSFFTSQHFEEDVLARPVVASSPFEDYWFWTGLITGHPTLGTWSAPFDLDGPLGAAAPAGEDGVLRLRFRGQTTDLSGIDQRAEVLLNGASLGVVGWEGQRDHDEVFSFPQSLLAPAAQELQVVALEGNFFVDSFDLGYRRRLEAVGGRLTFAAEGRSRVTVDGFAGGEISVYEVTDPLAVRRLDGVVAEADPAGGFRITFEPPAPRGIYLAVETGAVPTPAAVEADHPSDLGDPGQRADYLVIAPAELLAAAEELAELRRGGGLEARVVALQDIYDEFQHGVANPEAIRTFLAHAHRNWERAPRYVALIGKGSYDYRDLLGEEGNLLPPRMVSSRHGLVPSDSSFAIFDGSPLPRMAVGRLPVVSAAELLALVDKIAAYEASGGGEWSGRGLLVADNPDSAGAFHLDSDALAAGLPAGLDLERVYLGQPLSLTEARERTVAGFRDGARFVSYVGHGGFDRMAAEGLLTREQVPSLDNGERLPVVAALTCNLGMFAFPGFTSLGEALVIEAGGGAAAVWGPMGLSLNAEATALGGRLLPGLAADGGGELRLGDRLLAGLEAYLATGGNPELTRLYGLLGDAALEMPR